MDNNRYTKILVWNIRGINSLVKWDAIRDKISKSACNSFAYKKLKEAFDPFYIKKFCPRSLDKFAYSPSIGASGGLLTIWNCNIFYGSITMSILMLLLLNSITGWTTSFFMSATYMAPQTHHRSKAL